MMRAIPFETEDLTASAVEALKVTGDARAIAVLVAGHCELKLWESTGRSYATWRLVIGLPIALYYAMSEDERTDTEGTIRDVMSPFFARTSDGLHSIFITPLPVAAQDGWREDALRFVKGEGVTNQGRVRSDNIASKQHQGLLFRSQAEITLFSALTRAQLAVAPLPVFVRIGKAYNRLEPDFVVVYKGLTFVVEVDGDTYHRESPSAADKRLVPLTYEGVEVRRIPASELSSDQAADKVVLELIDFMAKRKQAR